MDFTCGSPAASTSSQMNLQDLSGAVDFGHSPRADDLVPSSVQVSSPNKSPSSSGDQVQHMVRQNQVGSVNLNGISIVSLVIDGTERLCLAQISNTLLKDFSYNEIHNRRVALGITCVQCTPVQLEILRRAGAMPISSRRCGMITKREAERLVKSFLEDTAPLKLPENFAFSVKHTCGWGCRGSFLPSRYNSSRAKCIKCNFCNIFFSPNKFIFHFHRTPESKYRHPDAANFNSWRRHIFLDYEDDSQDLVHAWEDVKAMFNGGSRKRLTGSMSPGQEKPSTGRRDLGPVKRPRMEFGGEPAALTKFPRLPYPYPVIPPLAGTPVQNTCPTGFIPRVPHPAFPFTTQGNTAEQAHFQPDPSKIVPNIADFWKNKGMNPYYNPLGLIWAKNFGLYGDAAMQYGNAVDLSRQGSQKLVQSDDTNKFMHGDFLKFSGCLPAAFDSVKLQMSYEQEKHRRNEVEKYMSAFRPVSKEVGVPPGVAPDFKLRLSSGSDEAERDVASPAPQSDHSDAASGVDPLEELPAAGADLTALRAAAAEHDDVDINVTDVEQNEAPPHDINKNDLSTKRETDAVAENSMLPEPEATTAPKEENSTAVLNQKERSLNGQSEETNSEPDSYLGLNQDDLQKELKKLVDERQRAEREYQSIVDAFNSKCNSESKETAEKTLREAHQALRHFSSKMMSLRSTMDFAKLGAMHE